MNGLYLYPQGYTGYNNNTNDEEQDEYDDEEQDEYGMMDKYINFEELKNDELIRHKRISHSAKLEEIFKRKQESKTPQDFKCNECFQMWTCAWCYHGFCDDIMSPYKLEGKPKFWSINDVNPEYWKSKTEKEKRKMIKQCEEQPPILKNFFYVNGVKMNILIKIYLKEDILKKLVED
jgi:hypothetical protein